MRAYVALIAVLAAAGCGGAGTQTAESGLGEGPGGEPGEAVVVPGSPRCDDLGFGHELRILHVTNSAQRTYTSEDGYLVVEGAFTHGAGFGFTSNRGVDAAVLQGPSSANVYAFSPESTGASGLVAPDGAFGLPSPLGSVSLCYDYELEVFAAAATSFTRDWRWQVSMTPLVKSLLLSPGQVFSVPYEVKAAATSFKASGFFVRGTVTVANPAPVRAQVTDVEVALGGGGYALRCTPDLPARLDPGSSLTCTYLQWPLDGSTRTATVTASTARRNGVGGGSALVPVDFSKGRIDDVDGCVTVADTTRREGRSACAATGPLVYTTKAPVSPLDGWNCELGRTFAQSASYAGESGEHGTARAVVRVFEACPGIGCTHSQSYWRTHSAFGSEPYDDAWAALPGGETTPFFGSGLTWYQALREPTQGRTYFILAHQFIAARLNGLNGADTTDVRGALGQAHRVFESFTPATLPEKLTPELLDLAGALGDFNLGTSGPGRCSE